MTWIGRERSARSTQVHVIVCVKEVESVLRMLAVKNA